VKKAFLLVMAIVEVSLLYGYSLYKFPPEMSCSEVSDGDSAILRGVIEVTGRRSFVLRDPSGTIVVLSEGTFERGAPVVVRGRVFERSGTKFLNAEKTTLLKQNEFQPLSLRTLAESPWEYCGSGVEICGGVSRTSSNWFYLESGGFEILVLLSDPPVTGTQVRVSGFVFYDSNNMRYKMRAQDVGLVA